MVNQLVLLAAILWAFAAIVGVAGALVISRIALTAGAIAGIFAAILSLPHGPVRSCSRVSLSAKRSAFQINPEALWLMGFGLVPAAFACALASPSRKGHRRLAAWRRDEPYSVRSGGFRPSKRRWAAHRLGSDKSRGCRHDPLGET